MKNTFGQSLSVTIFGESHGKAIGAVIDGIAPGIPVLDEEIQKVLAKRRPGSKVDTARQEKDAYQIVSGVFEGRTTGTPLCIVIPNEDTHSKDYTPGVARPSHADYAANVKYHGFEDYRGGGHFSGRITAALVAVGGILLPALERKGIRIGTHILQCGGVEDKAFEHEAEEIGMLKDLDFPVLDQAQGEAMKQKILDAREMGDSIGGVTQTAVSGLEAGLGEPWFDSVESQLSHMMFSLGGVKGIEFGWGFRFTENPGSVCNDPFRIRDGKVVTTTNHNGGINGGITNGMPVIFQCAVKPTPSISIPQETVDFKKMEETEAAIKGRHDPAIIRRICPVIDSVTAMVVCDLLAQRHGTDWLAQ